MKAIHAVGVACLMAAAGCASSKEKTSGSEEAIGTAFKGAIFTTTKDGSKVDANIYEDCRDVYLNGGPKKGGPALPEGDYYFMVTSPSGGPPSTLLSSDSVARRKVHVDSSGEFSAYLGGTHDTGTDTSDGSVTVQLWPFAKTPNPGNEYKAWLTPVDKYSPGDGTFGFIHRWSKTDNFKCKPPVQGDAGPPPDTGTPDSGSTDTGGPPECEGEDCLQ